MKKLLLLLPLLAFQTLTPSRPSTPRASTNFEMVRHNHDRIDPKQTYIIGGDITNTDVTIGIFKVHKNKPTLIMEFHAKSKEISNLYESIKQILHDLHKEHHITITDACFAIPGIAQGDLFLHPHLPWSTSDDASKHSDTSQRGISKQKFVTISGLKNIYFINDFQAVAIGTQSVDCSCLITLQQGEHQPTKPKLIIGAGNGLGASMLLWDSALNMYVPAQLNYSFTEYGAQNDLEFAFFKYLKEETGNVAWGKVLGAGAGGIKLIYKFFDAYDAAQKDEDKKFSDDPFVDYPSYLDIFKNRHRSARCHESVAFFTNAYARIIRNAAYAESALGGVYIANTVTQENLDLYATSTFMKHIVNLENIVLNKGSRDYLEGYLARIPFYVVTDPKVQLYGAATLCIEPNLIRN